MPTFTKRRADEVPQPIRVAKAVREQHQIWEGFVQSAGNEVGELELGPDESVRATKVRLTRAASRLGLHLQVWDSDGKVYFSRAVRRGRPRKSTT